MPWPSLPNGVPCRISVNSFGFGGTNAHAIVESYESHTPGKGIINGFIKGFDIPHCKPQVVLLFTFSAAAGRSLVDVLESHIDYIWDNQTVSSMDLAATLIQCKSALRYRLSFEACNLEELGTKMTAGVEAARRNEQLPYLVQRNSGSESFILGVFTGQGAQWAQMGNDLITSCPMALEWMAELQHSLDTLPDKYRSHISLVDELSKSAADLQKPSLSQPLCTAVQIVLVRFLASLGIHFKAVIGHSSGETAAAFAAGFLNARDAIRIAYLRGRAAAWAGSKNGQRGAMLAAGISPEEVTEICSRNELKHGIVLAASNALLSVTLSGDFDVVCQVEQQLKSEGRFTRLLHVDAAYHLHHMHTSAPEYVRSMQECNIHVQTPLANTIWYSTAYPSVRMCSLEHASCIQAEYWGDNLVSCVGFLEGLQAVMRKNGSPDMIIEVGPHPALKGPTGQILSSTLPSDQEVSYVGLLSRGRAGIGTMANAIGSIWGCFGPGALDIANYVQLFDPSWKPQLIKGLPSYPFSHAKAIDFFRRSVRYHLFKQGAPNVLLGSLEPNCGDREWRWHNYLKQEILLWLDEHRVMSRAVFPATGYIAMAMEAASMIVSWKSMTIRLVKIEQLKIYKAIVISEDDSMGVETLFRLFYVNESKETGTITGVFHIDACTGDSLQSCASGCLTILTGEPNPALLASRPRPAGEMHPLDPKSFYSFLSRMGYEYLGPFKGVHSILRQKNRALAEISNSIIFEENSSPLLHPVVLDLALQVLLAALGAPDDGEIFTLLVPVRIQSIIINPVFCDKSGAQAAGRILFSLGATTKLDADGIFGDCDLFTENGHGILQIMNVNIAPLQQSPQERRLFSKLVSGPLHPNLIWVLSSQPKTPSEASALFEYLERTVLMFVKFIYEQLTPEDWIGLDGHRSTIVAWMDRVLSMTREGKHPILQREWLNCMIDDLHLLLQPVAHLAEVRMTATVFANIIPFLRGEKLLLEEVRKADILTRFYEEDTGMQMMNNILGSLCGQIAFQYPRMRILEIGAGTGAATRAVLGCLRGRCYSYTFTDISVAFFEEAKASLEDHSEQVIYRSLDIDQDLIEQGFEEFSFDMIIASNVLHATKFLKKTMSSVRRLLKPGGYLAMQEVTNLDIINTIWSVCGFDGWWAGHEDGRIWGPMISRNVWDQLLKDTGFGGIDVYITSGDNKKVYSTSVIIAQAVDDWIRLLHDPLKPHTDPLLLLPQPTDLVILGGMLQ